MYLATDIDSGTGVTSRQSITIPWRSHMLGVGPHSSSEDAQSALQAFATTEVTAWQVNGPEAMVRLIKKQRAALNSAYSAWSEVHADIAFRTVQLWADLEVCCIDLCPALLGLLFGPFAFYITLNVQQRALC